MAEVLRGYTYSIQDGVISVIDGDVGTPTSSNARRVLQNLREVGFPVDTFPVIYKDSDGSWSQITLKDGAFHSFHALNETDVAAARLKAKLHHAIQGAQDRLMANAAALDAQHEAMRQRHAALEAALQQIVQLRTAPDLSEPERGYRMFKTASAALDADGQENGNG